MLLRFCKFRAFIHNNFLADMYFVNTFSHSVWCHHTSFIVYIAVQKCFSSYNLIWLFCFPFLSYWDLILTLLSISILMHFLNICLVLFYFLAFYISLSSTFWLFFVPSTKYKFNIILPFGDIHFPPLLNLTTLFYNVHVLNDLGKGYWLWMCRFSSMLSVL